MKLDVPKLTLVVLLFLGATHVQTVGASPVAWTTGPNFAGANGFQAIDTSGVLIEAVNLININDPNPGVLTVDPSGLNIDFTPRSDIFTETGFNTTSIGSSDAAWNSIIGSVDWTETAAAIGDFDLVGLTVGRIYQVQLFSFDGRAGDDLEVIAFSDGMGNDSATFTKGSATSIIGTFTADAATQNIVLLDDDNHSLNAYVLRQVPEPGSLALAVASLCWTLRRRHR